MSSCLHRDTVPKVAPQSTLEIADQSATQSDQPFGVVFASPRGETTESTEISILFNRPMRTLDLSGTETDSPAKISPDTPGSWRWIGTQGLHFAPETRLPYATNLVVTVPAGTRSLDGTALSEPYEFRFNTKRPALVRVTRSNDEYQLRPSSSFILRFNQGIADAEIARAIELTASSNPGHSIPFAVMRPDANDSNSVQIVPSEPLPLDSTIQITADESLRGVEGPLTAGKRAVFEYSTYGPLRVVDYYCGYDERNKRCAPRSSVHIRLSNPVYESEARKSVSIAPATQPERGVFYESEEYPRQVIRINGGFLPSTTYRITLKANLRDAYGQYLGKDEVVQVRFGSQSPRVKIGLGDSDDRTYRTFMEPGSTRNIPVTYVNANPMDLLTVKVGEDDLGLLESGRAVKFDELAALPGAKQVHVQQPHDPNRSATHVIRPVDVLGGKDKRGPLLIAARYTMDFGDEDDRLYTERKMVQVTDLGISVKMSRFGSLVWINRLSDAKPVEGAEVRIRAPGGSSSTDQVYRTDSNGIAMIDDSVLHTANYWDPSPLIIAKHGQDWVYQSAGKVREWYRYGDAIIYYGDIEPMGMVFTDRGIYRPGHTVRIKAILRDPGSKDVGRLAGKKAKVTVTGRGNKTLAVRDVKLSQFGTLAVDFRVPENAALGKCDVSVSVDGSKKEHASGRFEIAEYRPAEFAVRTEFDRRSYIRGDSARCTTHGEYLFGSPMSGAAVSMTVRPDKFQFKVPNTDGFITSDYEFGRTGGWRRYGAVGRMPGHSKLDQSGEAGLNAKLKIPQMTTTESLHCEAEVSDASRQTV
ncbi:MAG: MG2 domain-containing protein, partial [Polyangiaceae bacterium]|nr:MG2 domain-containing protein [Polyangiaceae bacterium]